MRNLLIITLMLFICMGTAAAVTVCSTGCDYTDLETALTAINGTNATAYINESGSYTLTAPKSYLINDTSTGSVASADGVIHVLSDNVIIDCMGSTLTGNNTDRGLYSGIGIHSEQYNNITIRNCILQNYTYGLFMRYSNQSTVQNITSSDNRYGLLDFTSSDVTITQITSLGNRYGIDIYGAGSSLDTTTRPRLSNIRVSGSALDGLTAQYAVLTISNATIRHNGGGIGDSGIILQASIANITNTTFRSNDDQGLYLWTDSTVVLRNITLDNQSYGIVTEDNISLEIHDSTLDNSSYPIFDLENSTILIERSTLNTLPSATDFTINDNGAASISYIKIRNMSYDSSKLTIGDSLSRIFHQWYIRISVDDSVIYPTGVNVTISDINSTIHISDLTTLGNLSQLWYPMIASEQYASGLYQLTNYTINAYSLGYVRSQTSFGFDTNRWLNITLANQSGSLPNSSSFTGNTTDFTSEADLESVTDGFLEKADGNILFFGLNNYSGADLDMGMTISFGIVGLNSTELPTLNVSARIAMYNVNCPVSTIYYSPGYVTDRVSALSGGSDCELAGVCSLKECSGSILKFNVSSFSSFAYGNTANLTVWDDTDNMNMTLNRQIGFYANFTNNTNPIGTTACSIIYNISGGWTAPVAMAFNATREIYEHNRSFPQVENTSYAVVCDGLPLGFEALNATDNFTVFNDTQAPTVEVTGWPFNASPPGYTVWFMINASDDLDPLLNVSLSVLNGSGNAVFTSSNWSRNGISYNITFSVPSLAEGIYYLNASATDDAGNIGKEWTVETLEIVASSDAEAPGVTLVYPTNGSLIPVSSLWTWLNITTNETAMCKYSGSAGFDFTSQGTQLTTSDNLAHSYNYSPVAAGNSYTVYYKCNDSANNINVLSVEHVFGVTPDTTSPNISYSPPTPDLASTINVDYINVRVNLTETSNGTLTIGGNSYTLRNSTGGDTGTYLNRTVYGLADGAYSYYVNIWDLDSNPSTGATRTVTIDTTGPVITFTSPTSYSTVANRINILLSFTTNEAATCIVTQRKLGTTTTLTDLTLTASTAANTSFQKYFNSSLDSTGYDNYFAIQCTDRYSQAASRSTYFKINDTVGPSLTFVYPSPSNGGGTNSGTVRINITSTEPLSVKNLRVDGGSWVTMSGSSFYYYTFTSLNDSQHTVQANVSDSKGNYVTSSISFTVDTTFPEIELISPDDRSTVSDCVDVLLNVTTDEEASCEFEWFINEEEECNDECDEDYDRCYDRADDSAERTECRDEQDECDDDCVEEQYNDFEEGDLEEEDRDICDDCLDLCEDDCDTDYDECMDDADDDDDEDDCEDDFDECVEEDCPDDCEDQCIWAYSLEWEECVEDGEYRLTFTCEDDGGNRNSTNSSFTMRDRTAPKITAISSGGLIYSSSTTLSVSTHEPATCRYSETQTSFVNMETDLTGSAKIHTKVLSFASAGEYTYNVACNDSSNNIMTTYNTTTYDVRLTSNPLSYHSADILAIGSHEFTFDNDEVPVTSLTIKLKAEVTDETVEVEVLPSKPSSLTTPPHTVYKYMDIRQDKLNSSTLESATIRFKVPKSWMSSQGVSASQIVLSHYDGGWTELPTTKESEDALNMLFKAETTTLSYFAIAAKAAETVVVADPVDGATGTEDTNETIVLSEVEGPDVEWPDTGYGRFSWLWILLGILAVGGAGAAVWYTVKGPPTPKEKKEPEHEPPLTETEEIIQSSLSSGLTVDQVKESFADNGWSEADFQEVYGSYLEKTSPPEETPAEPGDQIAAFINECKLQGMGQEEIIHLLVSNGWPQADVEAHFTEESEKATQSQSMPSQSDQVQEPAPDLGRFITEAISTGKSNHEIVEDLLAAGWPKDSVMQELHTLEDQKSHMDPADYIQKQLASGMSEDQVKQTLRDAGWTEEHLEEAFR